MADSSNSSATSSTSSQSTGSQSTGSQTSSNASTSGATTSNSTGNFSGGLPGLGGGSWSSPSSETAAAHASGVQGPGLANGNFGSSWSGNGNSGSGSGDYTYNNTSYSNNKSEPVMTVDEVYGKTENALGTAGNQSIVESQGDYAASSNEKSGVETSTFGKQDNITVTPESVTENKGLVDNAAIDSIEGLNFQQKDKESQDVMEARKSRDEAESEDKSNQMRESIKAREHLAANEEEENDFDFKVGESEAEKAYNDEDAAWQQNLQEQKAQIDAYKQAIEDTKAEVEHYESSIEAGKTGMKDFLETAKTELAQDTKTLETLQASYDEMEQQYNDWKDGSKSKVENGEMVEALAAKAKEKADKAFEEAQKEREYKVTKQWNDRGKESIQIGIINAVETLTNARPDSKEYNQAIAELQGINQDYIGLFKGDPFAYKNPGKMLETITNAIDSQTARFKAAYDAIANSRESDETKAHATDVLGNVEKSVYAVEGTANALAANLNDPAAIEAYVNAVKAYNDNLKDALNDKDIGKTDFNKTFTEMIAKANDFDVTLPDGTKSFAEFATEMAVRSPEIAKGMYEAKADRLEADGHPVLAKIERAKASMVQTWLGSKITFADNQVRNQFVQMAKTDMRATYATYNNVLNDPNATAEAKAEAEAQISQAKALMTASAALQASTGFLSGIGDSMKDGVYGVTDPAALNAYQKTLNAIDNFTKITLGLGVTPGANKAYQNMYYLAADKVNKSNLFNKDFDGDGFALCQEYGNNAAAGMIAGAGKLATGIALFFNPAMSGIGINLVIDSVQTFIDGLYGVQKDARKSEQYTNEVLSYFKEAESIAAETGNKEALDAISSGITQIENFELKSDEVGNLDNWLEGSGSNTATNEKFNQALSYDEWLKLIEADPTMQEYAKKLIAEKKEK